MRDLRKQQAARLAFCWRIDVVSVNQDIRIDKRLSLMQFVSAGANLSAHMKTLVKQRHGLSFGMFIGFLVPNEEFDLLGE